MQKDVKEHKEITGGLKKKERLKGGKRGRLGMSLQVCPGFSNLSNPPPKPTGRMRRKRMKGRASERGKSHSCVWCGKDQAVAERGSDCGEAERRAGGVHRGSANIRFHYLLDSRCICSPPGFKALRTAQGRWHVPTGTPQGCSRPSGGETGSARRVQLWPSDPHTPIPPPAPPM